MPAADSSGQPIRLDCTWKSGRTSAHFRAHTSLPGHAGAQTPTLSSKPLCTRPMLQILKKCNWACTNVMAAQCSIRFWCLIEVTVSDLHCPSNVQIPHIRTAQRNSGCVLYYYSIFCRAVVQLHRHSAVLASSCYHIACLIIVFFSPTFCHFAISLQRLPFLSNVLPTFCIGEKWLGSCWSSPIAPQLFSKPPINYLEILNTKLYTLYPYP